MPIMSAEHHMDSLVSFRSSGTLFQSATLASSAATDIPYDLLTFLGIAQHLNIDFLPISWDTDANIGEGGTAKIGQSSINLESAFAFQRLASVHSARSEAERTAIYEALIAEISVLGHKNVRGHPNINRLQGICWDIEPESERVWPVLVFEKTQHGDLKKFMELGAGAGLDLKYRLKLCAEIATAVSHLHMNGIVHGDIKPANVLIFGNSAGQYVARVADFGYSTLFGSVDSLVFMPRSPHWTAPEWHHRAICSASAVRMDVFSFGMLCLWLLFYHGGENVHRNFHQDLELVNEPLNLAHRFVMGLTDVSDEQRHLLRQLFELSLAIDPTKRCSNCGQLGHFLAPDRILETPASETLESDLHSFLKDFRVASSILPLYQAHHSVRTHIASCLEDKLFKSSKLALSSQPAAFELSFCYTLGFGVNKDDAKASALLKQASRSQEQLTREIDRVRYSNLRTPRKQNLYNLSLFGGYIKSNGALLFYRGRRTLDDAASRIRKEVADAESVLGIDHRITGVMKSMATKILMLQERWEEAQELETEVVRCHLKILGEQHPDTLSSQGTLAIIHSRRNQWDEAELLGTQVMTGSLLYLGLDHAVTLGSMRNLALILRGQGKWEKAERLGKQVLEIRKTAYGLENPDTKSIPETLTQFDEEGDFWKREEGEALKRQYSILPSPSAVLSLADLQRKRVEREQTDEYFLQMLRMKEEVLGRDHPLVLNILMVLATSYKSQVRWKEAEERAVEVVATRERKLPQHCSTITAMILLGSIYKSQGRWKDAEELQLRAIDASSKIEMGEPERLIIISHLAKTYSCQGRLSEAEGLQVQIMEGYIMHFGPEHRNTLNIMGNLAFTYMKQGRWKEAESLVSHVANSRQSSLGPDHSFTLDDMTNLVRVYQGQDRWEEARKLAVDLVDKTTKTLGERHPRTLVSMYALARTWHALERPKEALVLLSKIVDLSKAALGTSHPDTIHRKQTFDNWVVESKRSPPTEDDEEARTFAKSHDRSTTEHKGVIGTFQVPTRSTQKVHFAANGKSHSGIRKPNMRKRKKLASIEALFTSKKFLNLLHRYIQNAQTIRNLVIEYGVD